MTELLTAAQMRAIEAAAIASGEVTGLELMERAGQGVVDAIFAHWPELAPAAGGERGIDIVSQTDGVPTSIPASLRSSPMIRRRAALLFCAVRGIMAGMGLLLPGF